MDLEVINDLMLLTLRIQIECFTYVLTISVLTSGTLAVLGCSWPAVHDCSNI